MPAAQPAFITQRLAQLNTQRRGPKIVHGDDILDGPYPKSFEQYIGQETAKRRVNMAIAAAKIMETPLDHILLASGFPGVGKSSMARLIAFQLGVGLVELSGTVSDKDVAAAFKVMKDGDILLFDEIQRLMSGGKGGKFRVDGLLPLLQDGVVIMPTGVVVGPKIVVIATTTDKGLLPQTIIDRFAVQPVLDAYTLDEAVQIARIHARRLGFGGEYLPMPESDVWLEDVAKAAKLNPRRITTLLKTVGHVALSTDLSNLDDELGYDIAEALDVDGITTDGLTMDDQGYLLALFGAGGVAGVNTLQAMLNIPQLVHIERTLIQEGMVAVTPKGRMLTDFGMERAIRLANSLEATA